MERILFWSFVILNLYISDMEVFTQDKLVSFLTEPFSERPLTLHQGQFSFQTGYEFSVLNKKYTNTGELIILKEEGSAAVKHSIPFKVEFGLLEHLQFSAGINYASSGLRSLNRTIFGYETYLDIYELTDVKGPDQLSLGLILRAPTGIDHFDISVSGGLNIPVSDNKPDQPDHSYFESGGSAVLNYHYHEKFSTGIKSAEAGATIKYRNPHFSLLGRYTFGSGLEDGTSIYWNSLLDFGKFQYTSQQYNFNIGQYYTWEGLVSYQAIKWANFQFFLNGFQSKNGWSNQSGLKIGYPEMSVIYAGVGYEIQVAPHLRLSQQLHIPLSGNSYSASTIFTTGIIFNLISERYYKLF
jgi:hypothetical protein